MKRREFISLLGGAAAAWPLAARAQQAKVARIGFLHTASPGPLRDQLAEFHRGLNETGYVEGRNIAIEYRWAEGQYERLPMLAGDLVRGRVAVIVAVATIAAKAAKMATASIPIVFNIGTDPVKDGLVASINRPGGNATGVTSLNVEIGPKLLELLHEVVPTATVVALLLNPTNSNAETSSKGFQAAARVLGVQLRVLHASTERDFDASFATVVQKGAGVLLIASDPFFLSRRDQLAALATHYAVPTIYQYREFAVAGGLMSYGTSREDTFRQAGIYTGKVLRGTQPADLPVVQPTKFELVINLKTAKALGLEIPPTLLARADEVIE